MNLVLEEAVFGILSLRCASLAIRGSVVTDMPSDSLYCDTVAILSRSPGDRASKSAVELDTRR